MKQEKAEQGWFCILIFFFIDIKIYILTFISNMMSNIKILSICIKLEFLMGQAFFNVKKALHFIKTKYNLISLSSKMTGR